MNHLLRITARMFFSRILPRLPYPVVKGPLKGAKFILGALSGEGGGATVYFNMLEPKQTQSFIKIVKRGDILFDVGANVGYYTVLGSRLTGAQGKVYSFEPLVRNLSYLHKHVEINKLQNVTIIPSACSDSQAIVTFLQNPNTSMGRIQNSDQTNHPDHDPTIVLTVTLDAVAQKLNLTPNIIKIDVEGAEMAVLKGAEGIISSAKPAIFLSVHSEELRTNCLQYLLNLGYEYQPMEEDYEQSMEFLCLPKRN